MRWGARPASTRPIGPGRTAISPLPCSASTTSSPHQQGWKGEPLRANFISVLCLAWPDGQTQLFEGKVYGHVVWPPRGGNGFGYDPIFVADGHEQTFGEMEPASKYAISHRTRAFDHFKRACLDAPG